MNAAKIRLSAKEMELITNADWILTKNGILQKVNQMLGHLQQLQQLHLQSITANFPAAALQSSPKISKGDNYLGLPYQVLDYPRCFHQSDILAVRTLFWWGNFFSITLHLSGEYKKIAETNVIAAFPFLKETGFYYCINDDPWEHHFQENNYQPVAGLNQNGFETAVRSKSFIKLAKKIPLEKWEEAETILLVYFKEIASIITR